MMKKEILDVIDVARGLIILSCVVAYKIFECFLIVLLAIMAIPLSYFFKRGF